MCRFDGPQNYFLNLARAADIVIPDSTLDYYFFPFQMESSLEFSSSLGSSFSSLLSRYRTFKVVVIGDSGVGKTCLTHRLCAGEFPPRVEATIGVDFRERLLDVDGEKIKVTSNEKRTMKPAGCA